MSCGHHYRRVVADPGVQLFLQHDASGNICVICQVEERLMFQVLRSPSSDHNCKSATKAVLEETMELIMQSFCNSLNISFLAQLATD